jgi:hypothetical protein
LRVTTETVALRSNSTLLAIVARQT